MKKELHIDIFDYTAFQLLYLLMFFNVNEPYKTKIKELTRFMEKGIYKGFYKTLNGMSIVDEEFRVVYTLEK